MADTTYPLKDNLGTNYPIRLHDNGDSTFSFGGTEARTASAVADHSGTITVGGDGSQVLMAQNLSRVNGFVQNQSTGDLGLRWDGTNAAVSQPSFWLPAGAFVNLSDLGISTQAIKIFGATTGQAFAAREW